MTHSHLVLTTIVPDSPSLALRLGEKAMKFTLERARDLSGTRVVGQFLSVAQLKIKLPFLLVDDYRGLKKKQ